MADGLDELVWDGESGVATFRNVLITVWLGAATAPRLRRLLDLERTLVKHTRGGFGVLTFVSQGAEVGSMAEDARKAATDISREMGPHTLALAQVIHGGAFWSATVRGVLAGVQLFARAPHPSKTFDSVETACAWIAPIVKQTGLRADELRDAALGYVQSAQKRAAEGGGAASR